MFHKLLFNYVVANASVMHFTAKFHPVLIEIREIKVQEKKFPQGAMQKSVRRNVWENARLYGTCVQLLSSFPQVYVPYKAKESSSGQSGCANFEYDISISIKIRFTVAHNENSSYKKV